MAEGVLKGSRSAEGLEKPEKPGKLSRDLLSKFTSDPSLTQAQSALQGPGSRLSAQSFSSSSVETATSQENIQSKKTASVRIKEPYENEEHLSPSSADEDMLSDEDTGQEKKKKKKKRSLKWKWSPLKRMRSLFKRKKSPTRVKSCEALPTEHYKATDGQTLADSDETLSSRTKSEPSLTDAQMKTPLKPVVHRPQSDPFSKVNSDKLLKGLQNMQYKGQDKSMSESGAFEERALSSDSLHSVGTSLDLSLVSSDGGTEAAVSFENLPSVSSIDGLQAAHDKIKIAPKHRRPPTRMQTKSSSMNMKNNPVKPHRRSKTDPKDLTSSEADDNQDQESGGIRNSDVTSGTELETPEVIYEPSKESIVADLKMKVNDILKNLKESSEPTSQDNVADTEKQETQQTEKDKVEEDLVTVSTTDNERKEASQTEKTDTLSDKENNGINGKQSLQVENEAETVMAEDKVLKERNGKKEVSRPVLDMGRRSESLQIFHMKHKTEETSPKDKPSPLGKGHSFSCAESKEKINETKVAELIVEYQPESADQKEQSPDLKAQSEETSPKDKPTPLRKGRSFSSTESKEKASKTKVTRLIEKQQEEIAEQKEQSPDLKAQSEETSPKDKPAPLGKGHSFSCAESKEKINETKVAELIVEYQPESADQKEQSPDLKAQSEETSPKDKPAPLREGHSFSSTESKEKADKMKVTGLIEKQQQEIAKQKEQSPDLKSQSLEISPKNKPSPLRKWRSFSSTESKEKANKTKVTGLIEKQQEEIAEQKEQSPDLKAQSEETSPEDKLAPLREGHSFSSTESEERANKTKVMGLIEKQQNEIDKQKEQSPDLKTPADKVDYGSSKGTESGDSDRKEVETSSPAPNVASKKAFSKDEGLGQPAWIQLANKRSQRLSQLIEEGGQEDKKALINMASGVSSSTVPPQHKIAEKKNGDKDVKPSPDVKEKPKVPCKPGGLAQMVTSAKPRPLRKPVNSTAEERKLPGNAKPFIHNKPTVNNQLDKCAVCGTRVYQMEKCNFDSSVLHKQCIKCAVCKRLLTVGNFVMAERKVYCKPHAKTVTVTT
ncbi:glutamic acid-rich protein-like [Montipora foliosa]|uniref:glutamic acid-rich protein-like n=1 Tax=Montipora foliosa TaxID=591990 RepID=UPI0035F0FA94